MNEKMHEFSIVREISRRELERHQRQFVGITVSTPEFKDVNGDGILEWACDVRVGVKEGWGVIRDVLLSQWAIGLVADVSIPVVCERSEGGRVTIIARSEIRLPDIEYTRYSLSDLDLSFMANCTTDGFGVRRDAFGHVMPDDPPSVTLSYTLEIVAPELDDSDFVYGETDIGRLEYRWIAEEA